MSLNIRPCGVCGSTAVADTWAVPELMNGSGELFDYFRCAGCGTLQITLFPEKVGRYYEGAYYSYRSVGSAGISLKQLMARQRDRYALFGTGLAGRLGYAIHPDPLLLVMRALKLKGSERMLDVGCGSGHLIHRLALLGFPKPMGVDPFVPKELCHSSGARVARQGLLDTVGEWDVVMFHHSLEHVPDPLAALTHASRLLASGGSCLVRVPLADSAARAEYGVHWVQWDAPRHFYLFSRQGVADLAERAGLTVESSTDDSTAFQFWGSEQYRRGISLQDPGSVAHGGNGVFSAEEMRHFRERAKQLNVHGRGDQAAFVLRKAASLGTGHAPR